MDRLLLSHPPLPAAGTDGDLLELDVLWLAAPSTVGLGILATLPEGEGKKKTKRAAVGGSGCEGPIARSVPLRIPSDPVQRGRYSHAGAGAGGSAEDAAVVPSHEIV
ncbi:uncharacterized protein [Zea mays]|uniref:uncharacterized protein n=1 Tax=Zea mays TaxID=4577 RepID=UPI0009A9E32C|nr:uncharacterized protein LOC109943274 [Zea mays]|eukprot:XP_020401773.1 uncharacterized protein LOC109943274 [Zea mays]